MKNRAMTPKKDRVATPKKDRVQTPKKDKADAKHQSGMNQATRPASASKLSRDRSVTSGLKGVVQHQTLAWLGVNAQPALTSGLDSMKSLKPLADPT